MTMTKLDAGQALLVSDGVAAVEILDVEDMPDGNILIRFTDYFLGPHLTLFEIVYRPYVDENGVQKVEFVRDINGML